MAFHKVNNGFANRSSEANVTTAYIPYKAELNGENVNISISGKRIMLKKR